MNRINEDELDWDDDLSVLDGVPYSGTGFLVYPDGTLKREVFYRDGFEEGVCIEWHPNGKLKREWFAERGRAKGKVTEWHDNETVKSVGEYEFGTELQYDEWNESGELILSRRIDEGSAQMKYVEQMRAGN